MESKNNTFSLTEELRLPLILILFLSTLCGCISLQPGKVTIPIEKSVQKDSQEYQLQPHDKLNVIYHFDTLGQGIYRISPHDRISIKFFSVPEWDDIYQVRPDGYISLPQLGELKVKNLTVKDIQEQLENAYNSILKRPEVFVSLAEYQVHMKEVRDSLADPRLGHARLITVRDDYKITMPLIGELDIKGKSLQSITQEANTRYTAEVPGIGVDILLNESQPRSIYVFGAVHKPGDHKIHKSATLIKALALAGGATAEASLETVIVLTREGDTMVARKHNFSELLAGKGKAALLKPEDILYVPKSRLSSTAEIMKHVSDIILFTGFDIGFTYKLDD